MITDGDGSTLLSKTCGGSLPGDITSKTNKVIVTFHSDYIVRRPGYKLSWTAVSTDVPSVPDDCYCGLAQRGKRIIGGEETEVNEYPWQVLIYTPRGRVRRGVCFPNRPMCGGSVIGDRWVLTAAHCLDCGVTPAEVEVYLGEHNRKENTEADEIQVNVADFTRHKEYDAGKREYDIALLKLTDRIDFGSHPHIRPICLPHRYSTKDYNDYMAIVTGWGNTINGVYSVSDYLREVDVKVLTNSECSTAYASLGYRITQQRICAAEANNLGGKDACQGDSGGPLITKETWASGTLRFQNYEIIGVVSTGEECALKEYPGIYTRVTAVMDWIIDETAGSWTTCPRG